MLLHRRAERARWNRRVIRLGDTEATCGPFELANSDEIGVADLAHVRSLQCHQRFSEARGRDELHLESIRLVDLDNGAEIARGQTLSGRSRANATVSSNLCSMFQLSG